MYYGVVNSCHRYELNDAQLAKYDIAYLQSHTFIQSKSYLDDIYCMELFYAFFPWYPFKGPRGVSELLRQKSPMI